MQNKLKAHSFSGDQFYCALPQILASENKSIKILMIGDVIGRGGRKILKKVLTPLNQSIQIDFITINGENLAGGFGITEKIYHEIKVMGVHAITMGNHWKDKADVHHLRLKYRDLVLPQNLMGLSDIEKAPSFYLEKWNRNISIINLMGNFGMKDQYHNPFDFLLREQEVFQSQVNGGSTIVVADIHAEASSEKQAIAWAYDGILAALIGTHTHTPTSDERITSKGTAFLTDVGMTGSYDSVIGMKKERVIKRLANPNIKIAHEVAENELWFCGFLVEIDPIKNVACACHRLQYRALSEEQWIISSVL